MLRASVNGAGAMLDGEAYRAHFSDDPAYAAATPVEAPRLANSAALLEALAALEHEFRAIIAQNASSTD
jgi:hypothetical protein